VDNWQSWATAGLSLLVGIVMFSYKRDKKKGDDQEKAFQEFKLKITERVVRIESEAMTDKEVRLVLQEFFQPFLASLQDINGKTDTIQKDVNDVKVQLASIPKRREDNE